MKPVLDWVKSHVLLVILGAVAVAALGLGWWFSGGLNESVRADAEARANKLNELTAIERGRVTLVIPGRDTIEKSIVINQAVLAEYRTASEKLKRDADAVRTLAIERNRGDHKPLLDDVFPKPPDVQRELVPARMYKALMDAYATLLVDVHAGMPPEDEKIAEDLQRRELQFINATLKKPTRESLDDGERSQLREELTRSRLALLGEEAQNITVYASLDAFELPRSPESGGPMPTIGEMFDWQWRFWIASDLMHAIADASAAANGGTPGSVLKSPVKRLLSMRVEDAGIAGRATSSGSGAIGAGFGGAPTGTAGAAPAASAPLGAPQIDQTAEAQRDYARSFTGRVSNNVYDVRRVVVDLVVATAQLPVFFDALAKQNFITVTDARVMPADPFVAAADGFIYGKEPVSDVRLQLETVWLREWTAPFMPAEVRTALGIGSEGSGEGNAEGTEDGSAQG